MFCVLFVKLSSVHVAAARRWSGVGEPVGEEGVASRRLGTNTDKVTDFLYLYCQAEAHFLF